MKCNVHSWMRAYIGVMDHPYFAVTGPDGSFELKNVPPGDYTLAVWQEKLGKQERQVHLAARGHRRCKLHLSMTKALTEKFDCSAVPLLAACSPAAAPSGPSYRVYISNEGSGDLTIIDPVKMEAPATVPIGKRARGIHPSADGKLIFVALSGSPFAPPGVDESTLPPPDKSADGIGVFDIAQNKMLRKVPGGSDPEQFAVGGMATAVHLQRRCGGREFRGPVQGRGAEHHLDRRGARRRDADAGRQIHLRHLGGRGHRDGGGYRGGQGGQDDPGRAAAARHCVPAGRIARLRHQRERRHASARSIRRKLEVSQTIPLGEGLKPMGMAMSRDGSQPLRQHGRGKKVVILEPATDRSWRRSR